jgi:hypothetical protein
MILGCFWIDTVRRTRKVNVVSMYFQIGQEGFIIPLKVSSPLVLWVLNINLLISESIPLKVIARE